METRILFEAEAQAGEAGDRAAYVLAGDGWHRGVIGIVASRIAERHHRPVVLIALDGDRGTGSGRSIAPYDLLAGLTAAVAGLLLATAAGATLSALWYADLADKERNARADTEYHLGRTRELLSEASQAQVTRGLLLSRA